MKAKIFLIVILLVTGASVKAQVADKITALTEAMKNIRSEKDEFTHITNFIQREPLMIRTIFMIDFFFILVLLKIQKNLGCTTAPSTFI
jgi:outer membrane lipoprotein-sorting protein